MKKNNHSNHSWSSINKDGHEGHSHGNTYFVNKRLTWIINIGLFLLATLFLIIRLTNPSNNIKYLMFPPAWIIFSAIAIFTTGFKYFKVYKDLIKKKVLSVNLLMAIAAHSMFLYSTVISIIGMINGTPYEHIHVMWTAIIYIITLMDIGHSIEEKLNKSSQSGFDKLKSLIQQKALVKKDKDFVKININEIKKGEIIKIKSEAIVPLDGVLVTKHGTFDNANITGESQYSELTTGKYVISGAVNRGNDVLVKVNKTAEESTIRRIIYKIKDSTSKITYSQKSIDKLVNILIPVVFTIAILTFVGWIIVINVTSFSGFSWSPALNEIETPFNALFTVLDIAAPCALGMAIPLITIVSSYVGGTNSIIFNSTKKIEEINKVNVVAFDKTGTLTEDRFVIKKIEGNKKYLEIAKALESNLTHPIAKSIFEHIKAKEIKIINKKIIPGKGIKGTYKGQEVKMAKSQKIVKSNYLLTLVALYIENKEVLTFELEPKIKQNAMHVITKLKKMNIKPIMITGDNAKAAKAIAQQLGIEEYYYEKTPEQKLQIVNEIKKENKIMYVGDGFNDIVASKAANVSVAFAAGDDILNDFTNISLVTNDLIVLLKLLKLAKMHSTSSKISIGSVFALSFALIPLAIILLIPPFAGAIIMIAVDILVVFNAFLYKTIGTKKLQNVT